MGQVIECADFSSRGYAFRDGGWHFLDRFIAGPFAILGTAHCDRDLGPLICSDGFLWAVPMHTPPAGRAALLQEAFAIMGVKLVDADRVWRMLAETPCDVSITVPPQMIAPHRVPLSMVEMICRVLKLSDGRSHITLGDDMRVHL